ncbi:MAG: hypothetical protein RR988_05750 [Clostridia bacterium]
MNSTTKLVISMVSLVAFIGCGTYLAINSVEVAGSTIRSISEYGSTIEDITKKEQTFNSALTQQKTKSSELKSATKMFESEKLKYNNISDVTIATIKDATKIEKYSLEYLWVKLGNYAKKYNLTVALVEPGGTLTETPPTTGETKPETKPGGAETTPGTETKPGGTETTPGTTPPTDPGTQVPDTGGASPTSSGYKIKVSGDYKKIADFIYVVENDNTLRFKLDNITMTGSTGVTAEFEIKNLQIIK